MGLHHLHKRKRVHQKLEKFPHENRWVNFLDKFLLAIAVIGPLTTIPQIFKIYNYKNAVGISVLTWSFYAVFNIPWIIYGFVHKEKPIIIAYILWLITNIVVMLGAILYG